MHNITFVNKANFLKLYNNFVLIKMFNFCAVCGCCTRTDIVREHLEDTLRICDVSAMGLYLYVLCLHICFCILFYTGPSLIAVFNTA
jgi:hypothetical protein